MLALSTGPASTACVVCNSRMNCLRGDAPPSELCCILLNRVVARGVRHVSRSAIKPSSRTRVVPFQPKHLDSTSIPCTQRPAKKQQGSQKSLPSPRCPSLHREGRESGPREQRSTLQPNLRGIRIQLKDRSPRLRPTTRSKSQARSRVKMARQAGTTCCLSCRRWAVNTCALSAGRNRFSSHCLLPRASTRRPRCRASSAHADACSVHLLIWCGFDDDINNDSFNRRGQQTECGLLPPYRTS